MANEPFRAEPPKQDLSSGMGDLVRIWQLAAQQATEMAAARRTIFQAYVSEGFTEAQALELIKQL